MDGEKTPVAVAEDKVARIQLFFSVRRAEGPKRARIDPILDRRAVDEAAVVQNETGRDTVQQGECPCACPNRGGRSCKRLDARL
jgi:hypothetical protein